MPDAFEKMDRMYRLQRYFYDLTRKYYLLGRDQLLGEMEVQAGEHILEVGCGTARNLIILGRRCPHAKLYGLDASAAMLETARSKAENAVVKNIKLKTALAHYFSFDKTFGLSQPFDKIFFSYSISMIPPWRESIANALANLKPGGSLFVVDFYDQRTWPVLLRMPFLWWLKRFGVHHPAGIRSHFQELENKGLGKLGFRVLYRAYAFISTFENASVEKELRRP